MAGKWTLPKILLGCFVLMVLVCGGLIAVLFLVFPNFVGWFKAEVAKAQEWEQFAQTWQAPPADAGPDRLFPATVSDYQKEKVDNQAQIPELQIMLPGHRASYRSGQETIEVFAYRATKAEQEAIFQRVAQTQNQNPGAGLKVPVATGVYARFPFTLGKQNGVLWWSRDWLFCVRVQEPADPEKFLRTYLEALSKPVEAPKEPAKPKT